MATIWRSLERGERFTPRVRDHIAYAAESTMNYRHPVDSPHMERRRFYAFRLLTRLAAVNEGIPLEREPFIVKNLNPLNIGENRKL
jgi:hypothetical protein